MSEYIFPNDDHVKWSKLDAFTQGYIISVFWTECNSDNPELEDATFSDLEDSSLEEIVRDCTKFQTENKVLLDYVQDKYGVKNRTLFGHTFWLSRNNHGIGFWDRDWGTIGDRLHQAVDKYSECFVWRGESGKVHVE